MIRLSSHTAALKQNFYKIVFDHKYQVRFIYELSALQMKKNAHIHTVNVFELILCKRCFWELQFQQTAPKMGPHNVCHTLLISHISNG